MTHLPPLAVVLTAMLSTVFLSCANTRQQDDDTEPPIEDTDNSSSEVGSDAGQLDKDVVPQFRLTPAHRGVSPTGALLAADILPAWQSEALGIGDYSASKSSPAVDVDRVYIGVDDGRLVALDREDGHPLWAFLTHRYDIEKETPGRLHYGIHGTPAFDEERVYVGDYSGYLYAVDKTDGTLVWEVRLGGAIGASPCLSGGLVYIAVEFPDLTGSVFVVRAADGTIVWTTPSLGGHPHASVSIDERRDLMFVGTNDGILYCFDIANRQLKWTYTTQGEIKSTAAVGDDTLYITSWDKRLHAVAIEDGAVRFTVETLDVSMSSPAIYDNRVYFGSHDTGLYAADAVTGEVLWRFDTNGPILSSPTIVQESGIVVVGSRDRKLYLVHAVTGDLIAEHVLSAGVSSVPVVVEKALFVNDDRGKLTCFVQAGVIDGQASSAF